MIYRIPLFDLNYGEEEESAVLETIRSRWISTGPKVEAFESRFAEELECPYAVSLSNCTVALHLALKVLGVGEGDEVICPSLTFVATVNAIRYVNAIPVFCDVGGLGDLNIDPCEIERRITPRTKAIIVMHYGGFPCDMDRITALSRTRGIRVVEDACHGPLSVYRGRKLGSIGDVGCFSFFSNKNISTGEGGMLVTSDKALYEEAKLLRSHGMTSLSYDRARGHSTKYDVVRIGYNYRMDDIRASLGLVQLKKARPDMERRALLREQYIRRLQGSDNVIIPFARHEGFVSNYIFPIILANGDAHKRDLVRDRLKDAGIQTSVHYPPVHRFTVYHHQSVSLPHTDVAADREVTLPMFGSLNAGQIDFVCDSLLSALR